MLNHPDGPAVAVLDTTTVLNDNLVALKCLLLARHCGNGERKQRHIIIDGKPMLDCHQLGLAHWALELAAL
jgi:hypothetical protein